MRGTEPTARTVLALSSCTSRTMSSHSGWKRTSRCAEKPTIVSNMPDLRVVLVSSASRSWCVSTQSATKCSTVR